MCGGGEAPAGFEPAVTVLQTGLGQPEPSCGPRLRKSRPVRLRRRLLPPIRFDVNSPVGLFLSRVPKVYGARPPSAAAVPAGAPAKRGRSRRAADGEGVCE